MPLLSSDNHYGSSRATSGERKPKFQFEQDDDDDDDDDDHGDDNGDDNGDSKDEIDAMLDAVDPTPTAIPPAPRRPPVSGLAADVIEEDDDEDKEYPTDIELAVQGASPSAAAYVGVVSLDILWDVMSCPVGKGLEGAAVAHTDQPSSALVSLVQRARLRMQTACSQGAPLGNVVAFGEFGNLLESQVAQALVSCGIQVVNCGAQGECARGGVSSAMISAMTLRALDAVTARIPPGSQPLLVASGRQELQHAAQELFARGAEIRLAAATDSLKIIKPRDGSQHTSRAVQVFGWPQLYPLSEEDRAKGTVPAPTRHRLSHVATHTPRPLPAWL